MLKVISIPSIVRGFLPMTPFVVIHFYGSILSYLVVIVISRFQDGSLRSRFQDGFHSSELVVQAKREFKEI